MTPRKNVLVISCDFDGTLKKTLQTNHENFLLHNADLIQVITGHIIASKPEHVYLISGSLRQSFEFELLDKSPESLSSTIAFSMLQMEIERLLIMAKIMTPISYVKALLSDVDSKTAYGHNHDIINTYYSHYYQYKYVLKINEQVLQAWSNDFYSKNNKRSFSDESKLLLLKWQTDYFSALTNIVYGEDVLVNFLFIDDKGTINKQITPQAPAHTLTSDINILQPITDFFHQNPQELPRNVFFNVLEHFVYLYSAPPQLVFNRNYPVTLGTGEISQSFAEIQKNHFDLARKCLPYIPQCSALKLTDADIVQYCTDINRHPITVSQNYLEAYKKHLSEQTNKFVFSFFNSQNPNPSNQGNPYAKPQNTLRRTPSPDR